MHILGTYISTVRDTLARRVVPAVVTGLITQVSAAPANAMSMTVAFARLASSTPSPSPLSPTCMVRLHKEKREKVITRPY